MSDQTISKIYEACIAAMSNNSDLDSSAAITGMMIMHGLKVEEQQDAIILLTHKIEAYFNTEQQQAHILDDQEAIPWLQSVPSDEYYSDRYYEHLSTEGNLPSKVISVMKSTNREILERLGNPNIDTPFKRQGLVVGNVQSGKTANYLSLINLAADYGYKLIILITGIHNNLRSQTQKRVNDGFIGYDGERQKYVGVGESIDPDTIALIKANQPHCFTTVTDDFNGKTRASTAVRPESAKNPVIMVVKKNYHTLDNIIEWLRNNDDGQRFINTPALIIDDEADNASINTSKNPNETTRINGQIREMFNLFKQGSYIGYTATPFANIFIDPDDYDQAKADDLFPKDFIFTLEAPSNYVGAKEFFLNDNGEPNYDSPYIEFIDDNESTIPLKKPKDFEIVELPKSLIEALYEYLVSIVLKKVRLVGNQHTSMLINVSHKTQEQKDVFGLVSQEYEEIRRAIKYLGAKDQNERIQNHHLAALYRKYIKHSDECSVDEFFEHLQKIIETIKVKIINSASDDKLDYDSYADGLNVIAIGGYSLSRGFTLEGLTISYLIRNTAMADTLLQMGRWFGYRDRYRDLCKLYIPDASFEWYAFIAQSIEELRKEFIIMEQNNLTPSEYGLKVRNSNTGLLITAKNKMRHAEAVTLSESFSESSFTLRGIALDGLDQQRRLFTSFGAAINNQYGLHGAYSYNKEENHKLFFLANDVSVNDIIGLLSNYEYSIDDIDRKQALYTYILDRKDEMATWDVVIHKSFLDAQASSQLRTFTKSCYHQDHVKTADGGGRILRPWEEAFGLTKDQYDRAERQRETAGILQTAKFYRKNRDKPLLVLKSLDLKKRQKNAEGENEDKLVFSHVPAFAISFPKSDNHQPVSYVVNKVYVEGYLGSEEEADEEIEE
ncbi:Z1 domain-containing protein [Psychrobacter sp. AOP7-D1-15]|uniref:Z1 domain-containing protein n=1 Tax=unclassified Psychrobacter TaxID=196806 RepID=UPI0018683F67|nr:Z1 domain-containing protein [Psychrobacter sp. FME61]